MAMVLVEMSKKLIPIFNPRIQPMHFQYNPINEIAKLSRRIKNNHWNFHLICQPAKISYNSDSDTFTISLPMQMQPPLTVFGMFKSLLLTSHSTESLKWDLLSSYEISRAELYLRNKSII